MLFHFSTIYQDSEFFRTILTVQCTVHTYTATFFLLIRNLSNGIHEQCGCAFGSHHANTCNY